MLLVMSIAAHFCEFMMYSFFYWLELLLSNRIQKFIVWNFWHLDQSQTSRNRVSTHYFYENIVWKLHDKLLQHKSYMENSSMNISGLKAFVGSTLNKTPTVIYNVPINDRYLKSSYLFVWICMMSKNKVKHVKNSFETYNSHIERNIRNEPCLNLERLHCGWVGVSYPEVFQETQVSMKIIRSQKIPDFPLLKSNNIENTFEMIVK